MASKQPDKQPTKQLLLLRHAKSDWDSGVSDDFARPLSKRGRRDAPRMGRRLATMGCPPQRIVASPSARTTETVELVCAALDDGAGAAGARVVYDRRLYHGDGDRILAVAAEQFADFDRVLIVAHNPGMELALLACCPTARPFADGKLMPTCALAVIDFAHWSGVAADGNLRALLRPSQLPAR